MLTKKDLERLERQNAEFQAVRELAIHMRRIELTPIVDDDYPEVRHGYESAVRTTVEAFRDNGRLKSITPESPLSVISRLHAIARLIESIENRCMAVDGPVTNTRDEMTDEELIKIYNWATGKL